MKTLIAAAALLVAGNAYTKTLKCESVGGFRTGSTYVLPINEAETKAIILEERNENMEVVFKTADVESNRWGFNIRGWEKKEVDWSQTNRCFVFGKASYNFSIQTEELNEDGTMKGSLQVMPNIMVQPNVRCRLPMLALPMPTELKCSLY